MSAVIQDGGITNMAEAMRSAWNGTALKCRLFKNNLTPSTASVLGDFTEADFAGYAAQNIGTWGAASVTAHVASITGAALTFTRSTTGTTQTIYGYYVTDAAGAVLEWGERDGNAPINLTNANDSYTVVPRMKVKDVST